MPKRLYIDQCALSALSEDPSTPWQNTRLGFKIADLINASAVEAWTSPVNVLEIYLCADFDERNHVRETPKVDLRSRIANTVVDLTDCKRMAPSFQFLVVRNFLTIAEGVAPACIRSRDFFLFAQEKNQQMYNGLLATLAIRRLLDRPEAIDDLLRSKITSRLLHSRFARDPGGLGRDDRLGESVPDHDPCRSTASTQRC